MADRCALSSSVILLCFSLLASNAVNLNSLSPVGIEYSCVQLGEIFKYKSQIFGQTPTYINKVSEANRRPFCNRSLQKVSKVACGILFELYGLF